MFYANNSIIDFHRLPLCCHLLIIRILTKSHISEILPVGFTHARNMGDFISPFVIVPMHIHNSKTGMFILERHSIDSMLFDDLRGGESDFRNAFQNFLFFCSLNLIHLTHSQFFCSPFLDQLGDFIHEHLIPISIFYTI